MREKQVIDKFIQKKNAIVHKASILLTNFLLGLAFLNTQIRKLTCLRMAAEPDKLLSKCCVKQQRGRKHLKTGCQKFYSLGREWKKRADTFLQPFGFRNTFFFLSKKLYFKRLKIFKTSVTGGCATTPL